MWIIEKNFLKNQEDNYLSFFKDYRLVNSVEDVHRIYENDAECRDGCCKFAGCVEFVHAMTQIYGSSQDFTLKSYDCDKYYPYLNFNLLNFNNIILPYSSIFSQFTHILERFPGCEKFFIRPISGDKIFTGTHFTKKWVSKELDIIQDVYKKDLTDTIVLVSPYVDNIHSEYRVAFYNGKVIGVSCYTDNDDGDLQLVKDKSQGMYDFFLNKYRFLNKMFTLDMCLLSNRSWKVAEINGFGTAGLYGMELDVIL
jgi:hypothetical protein